MESWLPSDDLDEICTRNNEQLNSISGMRILITGSSGFVGTWFTQSLRRASELFNIDFQVSLLSRNPESQSSNSKFKVESISWDLARGVPSIQGHFDSVVLLANPVNERMESDAYEKIAHSQIGITQEIIKRKAISGVRIIHASSGAVYGRTNKLNQPFSEIDILNPNLEDKYAKMKVFTEISLSQLAEKYECSLQNLRLFSFYGPGQPLNSHFAIGNFLSEALLGKSVEVRGNKKTKRSYMYPTDLISYLIRMIAKPKEKTLNVGSPDAITIDELAKYIAVKFGNGSVNYSEKSELYMPTFYWPDVGKLYSEFGNHVEVSLEDGLQRWQKWLISN